MIWLAKHWRWTALNLFAAAVLGIVLTRGQLGYAQTSAFDPMLESGKWAIRFLLMCLAMSPLNTYFGWRSAIPLRKPAGLWAFGFATLHVALLLIAPEGPNLLEWLKFPWQPYITLGVLGIVILTALAITSNRWAMRGLGKNWKRLHRLVYVACGLVVFHAVLATATSKKVFIRDPNSAYEMRLYVALLGLLLMLRVPLVRNTLRRLPKLRLPQFPKRAPSV